MENICEKVKKVNRNNVTIIRRLKEEETLPKPTLEKFLNEVLNVRNKEKIKRAKR